MKTIILSRSASFEAHLGTVLHDFAEYHVATDMDTCLHMVGAEQAVVLIHASSFPDTHAMITQLVRLKVAPQIGIASDVPNVSELLQLAANGISGYFNSYMAANHYKHLMQTLSAGQQWFAPQLQGQLLALAANATRDFSSSDALLKELTPREHQISLAVADGMSNKKIAKRFAITERTVKAHLTKIFKKLDISNRLALATLILGKKKHSEL